MQKIIINIFIAIVCITLSACANLRQKFSSSTSTPLSTNAYHTEYNDNSYQVRGKKYHTLNSSKNYEETGYASWYGRKFNRHRTYSGERFNMKKLTAAHRSLPMSTRVVVTNLLNGKQVIVRVNDRGPFVNNRLIDLSYFAAKKIGMVGHGVVPVRVKALA